MDARSQPLTKLSECCKRENVNQTKMFKGHREQALSPRRHESRPLTPHADSLKNENKRQNDSKNVNSGSRNRMVVLGRRSARSPLRDSSKSGNIPGTGGDRLTSPTHSMQVRSVEPKSPRSRTSSTKSASTKNNVVVSSSVGSRSNTFCKDEKSKDNKPIIP